jgi:hypothetical protein
MFNILIHNGNANQNSTEIPSHPNQNVYHQKKNNKQQQIDESVGWDGSWEEDP